MERPVSRRGVVRHTGCASRDGVVVYGSTGCALRDDGALCKQADTCSIVSAPRLTLRRTPTTRTEPSTCVEATSQPVSGAKRISRSCGYLWSWSSVA